MTQWATDSLATVISPKQLWSWLTHVTQKAGWLVILITKRKIYYTRIFFSEGCKYELNSSTKSTCCFLSKANNIFFRGDQFNAAPFPYTRSISCLITAKITKLLRLKRPDSRCFYVTGARYKLLQFARVGNQLFIQYWCFILYCRFAVHKYNTRWMG